MASNSISSEMKEIEQSLQDLDPATLDQSFLSRLEAAAEGTLQTLTPAEIQFEKSLSNQKPLALSRSFMDQLESVVAGVPFPIDDKIVLFPKTAPVTRKPAARKARPMWAAAAAVALIGAATALLMPGNPPDGPLARNAAPANRTSTLPVLPGNPNVPNASTHLDDASDEGITWNEAATPHRVLKFTYIDRIPTKDKDGNTVIIERPRVDYIYVPEKID